jgi:hypothetical protein
VRLSTAVAQRQPRRRLLRLAADPAHCSNLVAVDVENTAVQ